MPRPYNGGTYTQVRTFTWNGNVMTSETNPETGTVSYDYDRAGRLVSRIDAKHQKRGFDYDQYGRMSAKRYYRCDANNNNCVEDTNARVDYYYDYNPYDASRSQNAVGRLAVMEFKTPGWVWGPTTTRYHYSYNEAGRVTNQWLQLQPTVDQAVRNVDIDATYTWDNEGRMTSQTGRWSGPVESYTYDSMGRLSTGGATHGPAGELLTFNSVTRTYNSLGQLTRMTKTGAMDIEYIYTAGQNNGRITRAKDYVTGEDVTYQYDSLNRLMHAETADSLWGTTYSYDGWGNLTSKGTAPTFSQTYDPALNMAVGSNPPSYVPTDYSNNYDIEDRPKRGLAELTRMLNGGLSGGSLGYDSSGKKVFWLGSDNNTTLCEIYFYSITGQRLAQFGCKIAIGDSGSNEWSVWMAKRRTHVGGQLTADTDYDVSTLQPTARDITTDRLGSIRARGTERYTYYPYGEIRTSTGTSSLYAALESPLRGYDSNAGRFDRPDPLGLGAVKMGDLGSWNRFAYVQGDPVNYVDPLGLDECDATGTGAGRPCPAIADGGGASTSSQLAYEEYVTQISTVTITPVVLILDPWGGQVTTALPDITVVMPFPMPAAEIENILLPTSQITITTSTSLVSSTVAAVWSEISYTGVVSSSPTGGDIPQTAITASGGGFGLLGVFGGTFNLGWVPSTGTICVGASGGIGTPGPTFGFGTLSTGPGVDVREVLSGVSVSVGGNLTPTLGGQFSVGLSGSGAGLSFGTPVASATVGYMRCTP
jgi:RHS repeat-associated protein